MPKLLLPPSSLPAPTAPLELLATNATARLQCHAQAPRGSVGSCSSPAFPARACRPSPSNASAAMLQPSASASAAPSRADLLQLVPVLDLEPATPAGPRLARDTPSPPPPFQVPRRRRPPLFLPRVGGDARSAASPVLTAAARGLLCPGPLLAPRSSPAASSCSPASPPWAEPTSFGFIPEL